MRYLDLTLPTPEENLACDEVLLDWCEETDGEDILRVWEPPDYFAVLGYTNKADRELNVAACETDGIPILRRVTGGGTVLHGPGSLCYALILDIRREEQLASITCTNCFVMQRLRDSLSALLDRHVEVHGYTDLTLDGRKFSGNAQRRKKNYLLFHGTFLLSFDVGKIEKYLQFPSTTPGYRADRTHADFLANIGTDVAALKTGIQGAWNAASVQPEQISLSRIQQVARLKYADPAWTGKF